MYNEIINSMLENKLIVIVRGVDKDKLIPLAEALYAGGIRLMEITYSANGSISDQETAENIRMLSHYFEGKMHIGAGTVLTPEQVMLTKHAGGRFIISPNTDKNVIAKTKELGLISMPGALTPSEIQEAHIFGADFVKVFPVGSLGTGYLKAIKAPLSHIKLLAVGGINEKNMNDYLLAGACGCGVGANLANNRLIEANDFESITNLAKQYTAVIKECQPI